jgi:hypothetical protein
VLPRVKPPGRGEAQTGETRWGRPHDDPGRRLPPCTPLAPPKPRHTSGADTGERRVAEPGRATPGPAPSRSQSAPLPASAYERRGAGGRERPRLPAPSMAHRGGAVVGRELEQPYAKHSTVAIRIAPNAGRASTALLSWHGMAGCLPRGGASRQAATGLAVPRSAPQAWCLSHDRLEACPAVVTCCHMPWNGCCAAVRGGSVRDVERAAQPEQMTSVHTQAWRLHAPTYRHLAHTTRGFSALARRRARLYRRHALAYTARHWRVCGRDPGVLPL